jgi:hypothetical protein
MIAAALFVIEWGTRAGLMPGIGDLARYRQFPDSARALAAAPAPRIAFIGNSVTDRVRLDVLQEEWRRLTGETPSVEKFIAYNSNLSTWHRMFAQYFWKPKLKLDVLVITLYDGNVLDDSETLDVGNLALFFTGPEDRDSLFENEITSLEHRTEYLLSSASQAFAARDRIHDRVLNFIPDYRAFATATNELNFEYESRRQPPEGASPRTFQALESLLTRARDGGVKVCFVAFPMRPGPTGRKSYIISPTALEMIENAGMLYLDMRDMDELTADMYKDNVHLNAKGVPVYTRRFAQELSRVWRP